MDKALQGDKMRMVDMATNCRECGTEIRYKGWAGFPQFGPTICDRCAEQREGDARRLDVGRLYDASQIPGAFLTWRHDIGNAELLDWVRRNSQRSLYVSGRNGIGKTRATAYVAWERIQTHLESVCYIRTSDWLRNLGRMLGADPNEAELVIRA